MSAQIERLKRRLDAIPRNVREAVKPALETSGQELVGMMKHLAPKDTGKLEASIALTQGGELTPPYSQPGGSTRVPENAVAITAGDSKVRYAHLVEYGTSKAHAQPYFWPSYRLLKKRIGNRIKRSISKAVKKGWAHGD